MRFLHKRLATLEAGHDDGRRAVSIAYMVEDDDVIGRATGIWLDGREYTIEEFHRRFPRVDVTQIKVYRRTPDFDPEDI